MIWVECSYLVNDSIFCSVMDHTQLEFSATAHQLAIEIYEREYSKLNYVFLEEERHVITGE